MLFRRVTLTVAAAATALTLGAGSASAHFCYVKNLTPQAMKGQAGSQAFTSFGDLAAMITGLCPAGVQVLADAAGVSVDTPIHNKTVMAHGVSNGGIGHLDFAAIEAAEDDAVAACM